MILNGKKLKYRPFNDPRGKPGTSGQLSIGTDPNRNRYLIKRKPMDVANEYIAHNLAKLIGVPTSPAVLVKDNDSVFVGIAYEKDFKRANLDDFIGTESYDVDDVKFYGFKLTVIPKAGKYPDNDPYLARVMAFMAFRNLIKLDDNPQLAFVEEDLISFDYAESFSLDEESFNFMRVYKYPHQAVKNFNSYYSLENTYENALELLHRPDTDFLRDAYYSPILAFREAKFLYILEELDSVFPHVIPEFYASCFETIWQEIDNLLEF